MTCIGLRLTLHHLGCYATETELHPLIVLSSECWTYGAGKKLKSGDYLGLPCVSGRSQIFEQMMQNTPMETASVSISLPQGLVVDRCPAASDEDGGDVS